MKQHQLRLLIIAVVTLAALVGVIVLAALDQGAGTGFGICAGILTGGVPALFDAAAVERRRRTPGERAVADDVPAREQPLQVRAE
jgi:hypothetical protein